MKWREMSYRKYTNRSARARLNYENEKELYFKDNYITRLQEDQEIYETENREIEEDLNRLGEFSIE